MIVEMSKPPKAFGIYPGGQSGNPGVNTTIILLMIGQRVNIINLNFYNQSMKQKILLGL